MCATPAIHRPGVSNNRLQPPSDLELGSDAFSRLTELQLNGTLMSWQAIMDVVTLMPRLQRLESGYNRLRDLSSSRQNHAAPVVTTLNLDSNQLSNWVQTCQALSSFRKCDIIPSRNVYTSLIVCQARSSRPFLQFIRVHTRSDWAPRPLRIDAFVPFLDWYPRMDVY